MHLVVNEFYTSPVNESVLVELYKHQHIGPDLSLLAVIFIKAFDTKFHDS